MEDVPPADDDVIPRTAAVDGDMDGVDVAPAEDAMVPRTAAAYDDVDDHAVDTDLEMGLTHIRST